jgi:hypothetical protein
MEELIFHSGRTFQGNWSNDWGFEGNWAQHQILLFQVSGQLGEQAIVFVPKLLNKRSRECDNCCVERVVVVVVELANFDSDRLEPKV